MRKSICQVSCWMKDSILLHYSPYFYQSSCSKELKEVFEWIYCVLGVYIIQFNHSPPPSRKLIFSAVSEARVSAADARRAETAGVWVQKKGCPLPLSKNIFVFWTSLDASLDHFITIFTRGKGTPLFWTQTPAVSALWASAAETRASLIAENINFLEGGGEWLNCIIYTPKTQ